MFEINIPLARGEWEFVMDCLYNTGHDLRDAGDEAEGGRAFNILEKIGDGYDGLGRTPAWSLPTLGECPDEYS